MVDGEHSDPKPVMPAGVPQGSVLEPLIFFILKCYQKGVSNVNDCTKFHEDLNNVYDWSDDNNMEIG